MDTTAPATTDASPRRSFGRNRRLAVAGLALVTVGLLASCSGSGGAADAKSTTTKPTPVVADGSSTTVAPDGTDATSSGQTNTPQAPAPQAPAPQAPAPQAPAPQAPAPAPQAPAPKGPKPVITSFTTPENIDCHNGNDKMFSASWTTTGATKTTISIDGPGLYKNYGPNDSDSLPFNCYSPHTFLLTAFGSGGQTATRTITLQPRNVQPPGPTSDDEPPAPASADQ